MKRKESCCADKNINSKLPCPLSENGKGNQRMQPEHIYVVTSSETAGQRHGNILQEESWSSRFPCANSLAQRNGQSAKIQPNEFSHKRFS